MKIIVTGADGQLGQALLESNPEIIGLTMSDLDFTANLKIIEQKILDLDPDVLINCAAYTAVDKAEIEPDLAYRINALAVDPLMRACARTRARLIQISTDYVVDPLDNKPFQSAYSVNPRSVYARSKYLGEQLALQNPNNLVVRTSWLLGKGKNFVNTMLTLAESKTSIDVVADQYGRPTYAPDLADVLLQLIKKKSFSQKIIQVQNNGPIISWADLAEFVFKIRGLFTKVNRVSTSQYLKTQLGLGKNIAPRPLNSIFDLQELEVWGINIRTWSEAVEEYLERLDYP